VIHSSRLLVALIAAFIATTAGAKPSWLAGDHHIHSRNSVGWNWDVEPPEPIVGGDAIYPIAMNAVMARYFGLSWMVATDHGGPNHSKITLERAYPELVMSRKIVPDVLQFAGMEFNTPGADHTSLIIPHSEGEGTILADIERRFDRRDAFPVDPERNTEAKMLEALTHMSTLADHSSLQTIPPGLLRRARSMAGQHRVNCETGTRWRLT